MSSSKFSSAILTMGLVASCSCSEVSFQAQFGTTKVDSGSTRPQNRIHSMCQGAVENKQAFDDGAGDESYCVWLELEQSLMQGEESSKVASGPGRLGG